MNRISLIWACVAALAAVAGMPVAQAADDPIDLS